MPQPDQISIFDLPDRESLDEDTRKYFDICVEKLGMVPNVLATFSFNEEKLRNFSAYYNTLMLAPSGLSKLDARWWLSWSRRRTGVSIALSPMGRRFGRFRATRNWAR